MINKPRSSGASVPFFSRSSTEYHASTRWEQFPFTRCSRQALDLTGAAIQDLARVRTWARREEGHLSDSSCEVWWTRGLRKPVD
ncbi:hypothetical protein MRX96_029604 [Rhipicephalus microplus]